MLIGLDFDNTIVCYDEAIVTLAEELIELPPAVPRNKLGLRDYLRGEGREPEWTAFQGELYGPGMRRAKPFHGAIGAMKELSAAGHQLVIVSQRSLHPYAGVQHDLHVAARQWVAQWLQTQGLFADNAVHFLETRDAKIATIAHLECQVFVDDLPEVLEAPGFPARTRPILFASANDSVSGINEGRLEWWTLKTWLDLPRLIIKAA